MICKMKKLSLLLYHAEKDRFLRELQRLGVVHLTENPEKDILRLADAAALIKRCEAMVAAAGEGEMAGSPTAMPPNEILERFESAQARRSASAEECAAFEREETALAPWGEFDPEKIRFLAARGVELRLYKASEKTFAAIDSDAVEMVSNANGMVFFVSINTVVEMAGVEEAPLPARSLSALHTAIEGARQKVVSCDEELRLFGAFAGQVAAWAVELKNRYNLSNAQLDLVAHANNKLLSMTGWFPAQSEAVVSEFLNSVLCYAEIEDPGPGEDVPVKLKNGPFSRMFEPVLSLLSLPSYYELDPVPFFAPFLAMFIGLCMGDVGYGAILLIVSLVGYYKGPRSFKSVFQLISVLSLVTMVAGLALNSFFGSTLLGGPRITGGIIPYGGEVFAPLSAYNGERGTVYPMMSFAIVIGIIQVFLAVALRIVNAWRNGGVIAALYPFSFFPLFFGFLIVAAYENFFDLGWKELAVGRLEVGRAFVALPQQAGLGMVIAGLVLFMLFNNPSSAIWTRPLRGLWELFNFTTGMLSSILSYLRLFAIGLASSLLGSSFTGMALMLVTGDDGIVNWLSPAVVGTILILVVGHGLNLVLSVVSAIIHPLRLTFVEFLFSNLAFTGGSHAYDPFRLTEKEQP